MYLLQLRHKDGETEKKLTAGEKPSHTATSLNILGFVGTGATFNGFVYWRSRKAQTSPGSVCAPKVKAFTQRSDPGRACLTTPKPSSTLLADEKGRLEFLFADPS
jgi:hypothetical protein